jgi:hypothetical protein
MKAGVNFLAGGKRLSILVGLLCLISACTVNPVVEPPESTPGILTHTQFPEQAQPVATTVISGTTPTATIRPIHSPTPGFITPPVFTSDGEIQTMVSPDGKWIAEITFQQMDRESLIQLKVVQLNGSRTWTLVDERQSGSGNLLPQMKHWSQDSRYFYYSEQILVDGCKDLYSADSYWKVLDTVEGSLNDFYLPEGYSHSISPDDSFLVYIISEAPLRLAVLGIKTRIVEDLVLLDHPTGISRAQAGDVLWSPDNVSLVIAVASDSVCGLNRPVFSLLRVNVIAQEVYPLLLESTERIRPIDWHTENCILIKDWKGYSWWIDAETGEPGPCDD